VLSLETESQDYNADKGTDLDGFVRTMLHGKGHDRWYDKSFNVIVMANGKVSYYGLKVSKICYHYRLIPHRGL
jgi:carnitine O-palmitoyltransferase 1